MLRHYFNQYKYIMFNNVYRQAVASSVVFNKHSPSEEVNPKLIVNINNFKRSFEPIISTVEGDENIYHYNRGFYPVTNIFRNINGIHEELLYKTKVIRIKDRNKILIDCRRNNSVEENDLIGCIDVDEFLENLKKVTYLKLKLVSVQIILLLALLWWIKRKINDYIGFNEYWENKDLIEYYRNLGRL